MSNEESYHGVNHQEELQMQHTAAEGAVDDLWQDLTGKPDASVEEKLKKIEKFDQAALAASAARKLLKEKDDPRGR